MYIINKKNNMNLFKILIITVLVFSINILRAQTIVHDPVVIKQGDTYHLYCTGPGVTHKTSKDLFNWVNEDPVFPIIPKWAYNINSKFDGHIWAPDIIESNGIYYLYYSISAFGKNTSAIGVATNKSLLKNDINNKWIDHGAIIESIPNRDNWNAIDPNISFDENNIPWMSFGSFWGGMKLVKLNHDLITIHPDNEWYTIARRERSFKLPDSSPGDAAIEAPFIYKKNGYYYLFVSWDLCCRGPKSTYKVVVGRSKTLQGPYLDKNNKPMFNGGGSLVVEGNNEWYGIGHNSVYDFNDKTYYFSHAYDSKLDGKPILQVFELNFDDQDWPIKIDLRDRYKI